MGKASGSFLIVTGTLCAAHMMLLETATDDRLSSHQSSAMQRPRGGSDLGLWTGSEAWRAYVRSATPLGATESTLAVVTITHRPYEAIPPSAKPGNPASLGVELQRELKRVGCYDGDLNGSWTIATRKAMKAFTNRVNAALPVNQPDHILLALLRGHRDKACSIACPTGQGLTSDDRCIPNAILAQATKTQHGRKSAATEQPAAPVALSWSTTVATPLDTQNPPQDGRMTLSGPTAAAPAAPVQRASARTTVVQQRESHQRTRFGPEILREAFGLSRF
jgi:hypothetical protein